MLNYFLSCKRDLPGMSVHWGRGTHTCICVSKIDHHWFKWWFVARSSPTHYRNQWLFSIIPYGTYFNEIVLDIQRFSLTKMHLKTASSKWWQFGLAFTVLSTCITKSYESTDKMCNSNASSAAECYFVYGEYREIHLIWFALNLWRTCGYSLLTLHTTNACPLHILDPIIAFQNCAVFDYKACNTNFGFSKTLQYIGIKLNMVSSRVNYHENPPRWLAKCSETPSWPRARRVI